MVLADLRYRVIWLGGPGGGSGKSFVEWRLMTPVCYGVGQR